MVKLLSPAREDRTLAGDDSTHEAELVLAMRACKQAGDIAGFHALCERLLSACEPMFLHHAGGLYHRPVLYEEVLANMREHLLREAQDLKETFITQNFPHYLQCLAREEFTRLLRREGLYAWNDKAPPRRGGPHMRVPRALIVRLDVTSPVEDPFAADASTSSGSDVPDPLDAYEEFHAWSEAGRILDYLGDSLDRRIVCLRVLENMKWDEVAPLCGMSPRNARLRYARARAFLRACLERETTALAPYSAAPPAE
jgi:DNA-directed RNA polymerase specialized sigma24 family protein